MRGTSIARNNDYSISETKASTITLKHAPQFSRQEYSKTNQLKDRAINVSDEVVED